LKGDLVVYGRGDPTFSAHSYGADSLAGISRDSMWTAMDDLAARIYAAGVRKVSGVLVGDGSRFEPKLTHDAWEQYDLNWWYAAPISGLGFNDNSVDLTETPGAQVGAPATVTFEPDLKLFTFENRSRTTPAGSPRTLEFYRHPGTLAIWAEGDEPLDDGVTTEYFALPDPNFYFAQALRSRLERRGIKIEGPTLSTVDSTRFRDARLGKPLAVHTSRPVSDLVFPILNSSQNWYAEMLLKTLGRERGAAGSWTEGLRVERDFLVHTVGVDSLAFATVDGSGLAKANLVSARALARILRYAREHRGGDAFVRAMPRSGRPGSLKRRFLGTPLAGRVIAKTGSVERVHSLSGYVELPGNRSLVFSILANNYAGSSAPMLARIDSVLVEAAR
jgi:serine-type D-Ala-D-Ala carboxypeptidase/endopeptidase (penicillin-binding protein 4)